MNCNDNIIITIYDETSGGISINLRYINEEFNFDRYFNFQRKANEKCSRILSRIGDNILKIVTKHAKRNKMKNIKEFSVDVQIISRTDNKIANIENVPCLDIFILKAADYYLRIGPIDYTFDVNPPMITSLELPKKNIMAGFFIYPSKVEGVNYNLGDSVIKWFRSNKKFDSYDHANIRNLKDIVWEEFGQGYHIFTSNNDVSRLIKVVCTPYSGSRKGSLAEETVFGDLISPGPGLCPFEKRHLATESFLNNEFLRVMSYNLLAEMYADSDHARLNLFPYCPSYALDMEYRKQLFIKEILGYKADLICLQEVDEKIFHRDLEPLLECHGFKGVYKTKGGENVTEGLATLYRAEKLHLQDSFNFLLAEELENNPLFAELLENVKANPVLHEAFTSKKTIVQVCILIRNAKPSQILVVGGTHLYFEPLSDHIRLLQAGMALTILRQVIDLQKAQNPNSDVSLILCGDFNSVPENAVYRLMTSQLIDESDPDWCSKPGEEVQNVSFSHDLEISSACGTPEYTNYTVGFAGCLDYIFYQSDKFSVEKIVPFPTHEVVIEHQALPSVTFPSDHIALVADLKWK